MDFSTSVAYNYNETTKEYTKCYPLTHMNAVYTNDDETETLGNKLSDIDNKIDDNVNKIGVLNSLGTNYKNDLVGAINENTLQLSEMKNNKAEITYVDTKIASVVSGAPKPVSLVSQMTDTTKNYVYTGTESGYTNGNWYYYNGSVWVSGGTYQSTGIGVESISTTRVARNAITANRTNFLNIGKNLFNKDKAVANLQLNVANGMIAGSDSTYVSEYIELRQNTTYVKTSGHSYCLYDKDMNFISGQSSGTLFTTDNNIYYGRFTVPTQYLYTWQIEEGNISTDFEEFHNDGDINIEKYNNLIAELPYIAPKKNLFDKNKIINGTYINYSNGTTITDTTMAMTDYLEILPNTTYIKTSGHPYAIYDANKNYITGVLSATVINTTSNTKYIRLSVPLDYLNIFQFEKGNVSTSYEPYKEVLWYKDAILYDSTYKTWYYQKKLVTFGDSITAQGKWQPYLINKFGFGSFVNCGVGGTTVINNAELHGMVTDGRIATIPTDADVIIVMGGTNDMGQSVPLGDLTYPYDDTKFKSALALIVKKLQDRVPNALIVLMSPVNGDGETAGVNQTSPRQNNLGLTTEDYAKAVEEVAHFLSIPFIDVFGKTGINQFNRATYIQDTVHPNELGGKKIGSVVINGLKENEPIE